MVGAVVTYSAMIPTTLTANASDGSCRRSYSRNRSRSRGSERKRRSKGERQRSWQRSSGLSASSVNYKRSMSVNYKRSMPLSSDSEQMRPVCQRHSRLPRHPHNATHRPDAKANVAPMQTQRPPTLRQAHLEPRPMPPSNVGAGAGARPVRPTSLRGAQKPNPHGATRMPRA